MPPSSPWWDELKRSVFEQAGRRDKVAIDGWDGVVTYEELDEFSSRVAAHLQALGIGPRMMVPVCFEKSIWSIVATIGVHKTGAAFVPLDPALPMQRIEKIVALAGSKFVAVSSMQKPRFESSSVTPVIINPQVMANFPPADALLPSEVSMEDPGYCLFTSGSSGTPKGCIISQRAFAGISQQGTTVHLSERSRSLQFASYSFGISIIEIYCTLGTGGTVCVVSSEDCAGISNLARAITRVNVNWTFMTPTMVGSLHPKEVPCLKTIVTGGEPLQKGQIMTWADAVSLHQALGLTEWAGTCCISPRITSTSCLGVVGKPMSHARAWLVDPNNANFLAPVGAVAELCIEGTCLAQGYLNDPDRSSKAFISHPGWGHEPLFPTISGPRKLYRTGDLVRYMCDGSIQHLERKDMQRKVRGQRVEITEVEYHIRHCFPEAVRVFAEVICPYDQDSGSSSVLAAFVQLDQPGAGSNATSCDGENWFAPVGMVLQDRINATREALSLQLPRYMIPDLFLRLRDIPLTVSGKLDRRRLCNYANRLTRHQLLGKDHEDGSRRAPATEMETILLSLFAHSLKSSVEKIGVDDNFFHLGGDSLRAMTLVGQANSKYGLKITVGEIITYPTVSQLATVVPGTKVAQEMNGAVVPFSQLFKSESKEEVIREACKQCHVEPDIIEDIYPCTPLQEGMFALGRKQAGGYVARWVFEFQQMCEADLQRLKDAWLSVLEDSAPLRTRIIASPSQRMYQVLLRGQSVWQESSTLFHRDERDDKPDLLVESGHPLAQISIHRNDTADCVQLALTMHHSVIDGWCFRKILDQVEAVYHGEALPASPPFATFVHYLSQLPDHKTYWTDYFSGLNAEVFPAILPVAYEPCPMGEATDWLPLAAFTPGRFTRSAILRLAWAMVQSQYQGNNDIVYGLTVSGRNAPVPGILTMTSPTVATIPFRVQLDPAASVEKALDNLVAQTIRSIPHEQTGLQNMRKWGGDVAAACEFQTLLVIQHIDSTTGYSLLGAEPHETSFAAFCTYSLTLVCNLNSDPVELKAWFDPKIVPERQVHRILRQLKHVVQAISKDPASTVSDCMTVSPSDADEICAWNQPIPALPEKGVDALFHQQCVAHPDRLAVDGWDVQFTYKALDELSTHLAKHLVAMGIIAGDFVPICTEKSGWTIVCMLATIKIGAAFILLDPAVPKQRLAASCQQALAKLVLTTTGTLPLALELVAKVVLADDPYPARAGILLPIIQPERPLFAVFTSGSTGVPKAAMADHQSFLSYSLPIMRKMGIDGTVRWLQFSSYAFDMSVNETLWTLLGGGCICVLSDTQRLDNFVDTVTTFRPTHAVLTPSFMRSLDPKDLPSLRALMLGGEPTQPSELAAWSPYMNLMIGYGPAECGVTHLRYFGESPNDPYNSVGFPTGGASWLAAPGDPEKLLPIGAVGELFLEGSFVGPGYMHDPTKTQEAFIVAPSYVRELRHGPSRVYRTGDLMRYNVDGSLSFVGRMDSQVKIRGQRIELADIETHLARCFSSPVQVVVELVSPEGHGAPFLAAFIYFPVEGGQGPTADAGATIASCHAFYQPEQDFQEREANALALLRDRLPRFMIPSMMINLAHMPHTASGKVDRKYLRKSLAELPDKELKQFRATIGKRRGAATEMEKNIQKFCATALQIPCEEVSLDDNFLQLGGDSISAMYMVAEARKDGVAISVVDILENPRLSALASHVACHNSSFAGNSNAYSSADIKPFALVNEGLRAEATRALLELQIVKQESHIADVLPVTESQQFFLTQWTPFLACYFLTGFVDGRRLRHACQAVMSAHSILRTAFVQTHHGLLQAVLQDIDLPFHQVTTTDDLLTYCDSIWQSNSEISSTVNTAPLRFTLVSRSATEHAFILRISHAQYDGISLPTLMNALAEAYTGRTPEAIIDFASYMHLRSLHDHTGAFHFWRQYLLNSSVRPWDISTNAPPQSPNNVSSSSRITAGQSVPMPSLSAGQTVASLVKAAAGWLFARDTRQHDIVLGQTVSGRSMPIGGIEKMLGPCLNTIPFRLQLQPRWSALDLLQHVQKQCSATFAHDYVDLADIVRTSTDWPQDSYLPCIIQHQNVAQTSTLPLPDVECTSSGWAHFIPQSGMWILTSPQDSKLQIMLCTSGAFMSLETARLWVKDLATVITIFASQPEILLDDVHV
ncbi:nonribosomal peptide synthase [Penicillium soppii]|uniref:nonribosomal peptide synthase n=1 Tax=Penicillium soppii TaxID=69789 RepID=UPI0025495024|nr:nonribosomal peptide synthase [Penicillium soppii]KAJ5882099.1 nonribosomal peptide synthase [Penicillium soppii]